MISCLEGSALQMTRDRRVKMPILLVMLHFLALSLWGCAQPAKSTPPRRDTFERWRLLAQESEGHSPSRKDPRAELPPDIEGRKPSQQAESKKEISISEVQTKPERPLPTQKISLRMHNADIVVVLRTLSRAVNQNIVMNEKVKGTISIEMDAVPWDQAFRGILRSQGLNYAWEGDLIRVMSLEDMENELKVQALQDKQKAQKIEAKQADPLHMKVIPIDYADAVKLQDKLKEYLTKDDKGTARGFMSVDEHTNSLVINAIAEDIERLTALVRELDKPTPQILIESNIVEATKDAARNLGIQWGGIYADKQLFLTPGGTNGKKDNTNNTQTYDPITGTTGISGQGFGINFPVDVVKDGGAAMGLMFGTLGGNILDAQLTALQKEGKLNILSSPSIIALDNQTAFTVNGAKVPYVSSSQLTGTEVKFEEVVLRLEITPHVIYGDTLKMKITVKKDEVDPTRTVLGNPYIIRKETQTTLIARDGETVVISGLSKELSKETDKGVPGLKDAPFLGLLFKGTEKQKQLEEVLIFITPHILKTEQVGSLKERPAQQ